MQATSYECKKLLARLHKVVSKSDKLHYELMPNKPFEAEAFTEVPVNLKIRLKDEEPPCTI
jgi:hypothetical protein